MDGSALHPHLVRQLRRLGIAAEAGPPTPLQWPLLLQAVTQAYELADRNRAIDSHALAISRREMQTLYDDLQRRTDGVITAQRDRLAAVQQAIGDGVAVLDAGGTVVSINRAGRTLLGLPHDPAAGVDGLRYESLLSADDGTLARLFRAALDEGAAVTAGLPGAAISARHAEHVTLAHRSGRRFAAAVHLSGTQSLPPQFVLIFRDISAQLQQAQALHEAKEAAEAASVAKSGFLATMSHEIRTPLNGVLGMNELLLDTPLTERQRQFATQIRRSGRTLLALLNDVLDFSKIEAGALVIEAVVFDPRELLAEVSAPMAELARERQVQLRAQVDTGVPARLRGDPLRLRQLLMNLLGNALKFTGRGGHVAAHMRTRALPGRDDAVALVCSVADTGCGIAEESLQRLFQPFVQAHTDIGRRFGGTGLGLAIVKRLLDAMDGGIAVSSRLGQGSTFTFELPLALASGEPLANELAAAERPQLLLPPPATPGRHRVLLAEDDPVNQIVAMLMLKKLGCEVSLAENGVQALDLLSTHSFDLLLLDCNMPEMDGFELVRRLRRRPGDAAALPPMVAYTAAALADERKSCIEAGFDDHLMKPATPEALAAMLGRWLNRRSVAA